MRLVGLFRSEPHIAYPLPVARQVLEAVKIVEMVDEQRGDLIWIVDQTQVDGNPPTAILPDGCRAPRNYARATAAKVKAEVSMPPRVDLRRTENLYLFALVPYAHNVP